MLCVLNPKQAACGVAGKATLCGLRPHVEDIAQKLIYDDQNKTSGKFGLHPTSMVALAAACHALEE
jgi:hypothetical protein